MIKNIHFKKTILFAICAMSSNLVMAADYILQEPVVTTRDYRLQGNQDRYFGTSENVEATQYNSYCAGIPGTYSDCKDAAKDSMGGCFKTATKYCYICGGVNTEKLNRMTVDERKKLCSN